MADDNDKSLFGIKIFSSNKKKDEEESFAPKVNEDGAIQVEVNESGFGMGLGGVLGSTIDFTGVLKDEIHLIQKYRRMALHHEADNAIDDIINESIVQMNDDQDTVSINLDNIELSDNIKNKISKEFEEILDLLDFENKAYEIFHDWYVDGRLVYHKIVDENKPKNGIKSLRQIDPLMIQKVKEVIRKNHKKEHRVTIHKDGEEYYIYNEAGVRGDVANDGVKINKEAITYVHSGLKHPKTGMIISHLHKAIMPLNRLRMIEDAAVIYRLSRAPERRVFNIDTGGLPPTKAEQYVRAVMRRNKNRMVFDAESGELQSDRKHMTITEDFYFPKGIDGRGTTVESLAGAANLGEIEDILYFQKQFYKSLNVPLSRIQNEENAGLGISRSTEITRDELKFMKFVRRLQKRFSKLFNDILRTQLILKGIITEEDWDNIETDITYIFAEDSFFAEAKELENMRERISVLNDMNDFVGTYFSQEYIKKSVLRQNDDDIKEIKKQNEEEKSNGEQKSEDDDNRF